MEARVKAAILGSGNIGTSPMSTGSPAAGRRRSRWFPRPAGSRPCIMLRSSPRCHRARPAAAPAPISTSSPAPPRAVEQAGGAAQGKAIIILNPAKPSMIMHDTVFTLSEGADEATIRNSVETMVAAVQNYVSGYRLEQEAQFETLIGGQEDMIVDVALDVLNAAEPA